LSLFVLLVAALSLSALGLYAQTGSTEAHGRPATATDLRGK
jgi:hypothetical protein